MSSDLIISALNASNKAVVQKANATKASSDQFAKIFADNATAHDQIDAPKRPDPLPPAQTGYRIGVDNYHGRSSSSSKPNTNAKPAEPLPQTKTIEAPQKPDEKSLSEKKNVEPSSEPTLKKSSPMTESQDLKDQTASTTPADTSTVTPFIVQSTPILTLDKTATVENAQLALAAATISNTLNSQGTDSTVDLLSALNKNGLQDNGLQDKTLTDLKTLAHNSPTGLLLAAFDNSKNTHSDDKLFGDLLSIQPKVLNVSDLALIADFKGLTNQTSATATQSELLDKFRTASSLGEAGTKSTLPQPADLFKNSSALNTNLIFTQPFGSVFSTALDTVNTATKNIKEASNAASTATLASLPVSVASRALKGAREFTIHLHPAELGKVDIKMEINDKGEVKAHLRVERPETLALLQRDASALNRSLEQAGFKPTTDSLQFSLQQDNAHQRNNHYAEFTHNSKSNIAHHEPDQNTDITAAVMSAYSRRNNSALDIHI